MFAPPALPVPLGEIELLALLAAARHRGEAWGYAIFLEIWGKTPTSTNLGTVYKALRRLAGKGLLRAEHDPPRAMPGGRSRTLYAITPSGEHAVRATLARIARVAKAAGYGGWLSPVTGRNSPRDRDRAGRAGAGFRPAR